MKKVLLLSLVSVTLSFYASAQIGINGTGDVVKQEIQLETLKGVKLGFSGDIILTQGSQQKIVMEGQQNILDNIKREVSDGVWKVNFDKNVRDAKPVKIYITLATLDEVAVSGSGNITGTNTFQNIGDLEVALSGSGGINLSLEADDVDAAISGSGDITLKGKASQFEAAISGSGNINALGLNTSECEVAVSGSGDVSVSCSSSLEATISGSGDVMYKGDAPKVQARVSGSGDVKEVN